MTLIMTDIGLKQRFLTGLPQSQIGRRCVAGTLCVIAVSRKIGVSQKIGDSTFDFLLLYYLYILCAIVYLAPGITKRSLFDREIHSHKELT